MEKGYRSPIRKIAYSYGRSSDDRWLHDGKVCPRIWFHVTERPQGAKVYSFHFFGRALWVAVSKAERSQQ